MSKPYSEVLRQRVVAAVEGGRSQRQVAGVLEAGISTVVRWVQRFPRPSTDGATLRAIEMTQREFHSNIKSLMPDDAN